MAKIMELNLSSKLEGFRVGREGRAMDDMIRHAKRMERQLAIYNEGLNKIGDGVDHPKFECAAILMSAACANS